MEIKYDFASRRSNNLRLFLDKEQTQPMTEKRNNVNHNSPRTLYLYWDPAMTETMRVSGATHNNALRNAKRKFAKRKIDTPIVYHAKPTSFVFQLNTFHAE